ncbi:MAG: hypothetical protein PHH26_00260 [Candidatus Thermoplasmatota archaeon]|nr:hypothetical protein [Candidatus Thermoplasmatota archaeon]
MVEKKERIIAISSLTRGIYLALPSDVRKRLCFTGEEGEGLAFVEKEPGGEIFVKRAVKTVKIEIK